MVGKFIHHESFQPEYGQEGDGYDVIETDDGFGVWHHSMEVHSAHYLSDANAEAERLANEFDRMWLADRESPHGLLPAGPDEWLVAVTDPDGDRILSETFGGDYSLEQIREQALRHFNPPPGHTLRFYPIGEERVDLALGIA
jgi:hypothetical protein